MATSTTGQRSDQPVHIPIEVRTGRGLWATALVAALAGLGFTTVQIMERITILKDPTAGLLCDVNGVVSCSNVLSAWQSSVLGPPNALIGAIMFALLGSGALSGLLGSRLARPYLVTLWGLAVFFLCFASWFMFETAFSIGSLCLWCTGIVTAVVVICACLTRLAERASAFGTGTAGGVLRAAVHTRVDLLVWTAWWLTIAVLLWIGLSG